MSLASEILALLRASGQEGQRVLPGIASDLERFPGARGAAIEADLPREILARQQARGRNVDELSQATQLESQLSRAAYQREPPIGASAALADPHQPQLPLDTSGPVNLDELLLDIKAPGDRGAPGDLSSMPWQHSSPMEPFPSQAISEQEDPRFAMALAEDQRLSPLQKQELEYNKAGNNFKRTGPLVPDNSAFPEQKVGWEPEAIPEDTLEHTGTLEGRPRVADSDVARRQAAAQEIPPEEFYDTLPSREQAELPPIGPRIDQLPEVIDPELHPGVLQEPEFVMQTPVMAKLRELTKVQRLPIEERLQTRLENANAYVERAFPNKAPLEDHNLGPNQVAPHRSLTDETGDFAKSMLQKWEQKLRGGLTAGEEGTVSSGVNKEDVRILKEFNRMMRTNPHEAVAFLANAVTGRKGEISDFTGAAKAEGILSSNKRSNRQRMAEQFGNASRAKQEQGLPSGEHMRNQQYSAGKARIPVQTEEIVNPEAVKGIRPGVPEDPFEGVRSGHVRSIVVGDKELKTNTGVSGERIKPGRLVAITDGQGKVIHVEVTAVRRISEHDAAAVGLRQGTTPQTMSEIIRQQEARTGPQFEVVFKPIASHKEGVESTAVTNEAIREGKKSAKEAYMGIGAHSTEAKLPKEHVEALRAQGYDMDTPIINRSKQTGSPYIVAHKTDPKNFRNVWTEDVVEKMRAPEWANTDNRRAMLAEGEAALKDPLAAKYTSKSQIRFNKNAPRDSSELGKGANIPIYPEGPVRPGEYMKGTEPANANTVGSRPTDRREGESRPTSVGKVVSDPKTIVDQMRKGNSPKGTFFLAEHFAPGFAAKNSDATLSIGEDALARSADPKSIDGAVGAINKKVGGSLKAKKQIILNISGPDSHALKSKAVDPMDVAEILQGIMSHPGRSFDIIGVLSDGQPGVQEAGVNAARQLGVPTAAVMGPHMQVRHPKTGRGIWVPREIHEARFRGEDVSAHYDRLLAEGQRNIDAAKARK